MLKDAWSSASAVPLHDFAFADTVFADELSEEAPPSSGARFATYEAGAQIPCVTALAFPLPIAAPDDVRVGARVRALATRVSQAFQRSIDEMRELWAGTAEMVGAETPRGATQPSPSLRFVLRRALALWSCFQWSRADVIRAAMIGVAVFVIAAAIGGTTMGDDPSAASGSEVRAGRTLDQHTGKKIGPRAKR